MNEPKSSWRIGAGLVMLAVGFAGVWPTAGQSPSSQNGEQTEPVPTDQGSLVSVNTDIRVLHVALRLRNDTVEADTAIVEALRHVGWFTHVILAVSSWQETPQATRHPLIQQALTTCRQRRLSVIWGRWLWVAWPNGMQDAPDADSHFNAAYYAKAIETLQREAKSIQAAGTFLDAEPYGHSAQKPTLKYRELNDDDRQRIRAAVTAAVAQTGPVDLLYPTSSMRPTHFAWPLGDLGRLHCDAKTYYVKPPGYRWPKVNPPAGYEHRLDLWGCNVGLGQPKDRLAKLSKLTIEDVKSLDLTVIRKRYPTCRGIWVYVDQSILVDVMKAWSH